MTFTVQSLASKLNLARPRLAATSSGEVAIAWAAHPPSEEGVFLKQLTGGQWHQTIISPHACAGVRIAVEPGGRVWAVWDTDGQFHQSLNINEQGVSLVVGNSETKFKPETIATNLWRWCSGTGWSLAVGADGSPAVAWCVDGKPLSVVRRVNDRWVAQPAGHLAERDWCQIAIDGSGHIHALYERKSRLFWAVLEGSHWAEREVGSGADPSFAIDADNRPHVAFSITPGTKDQLHYAYLDGDTFKTELVDKKGHAGHDPRIALDSQGNPHIGYRVELSRRHASSRRIGPLPHRVAQRRNGKWLVTELAEGGAANDFALAGEQPWAVWATTPSGNLSVATTGPTASVEPAAMPDVAPPNPVRDAMEGFAATLREKQVFRFEGAMGGNKVGFWEFTVSDTGWTVLAGELGTKGKKKSKKCKSLEEAIDSVVSAIYAEQVLSRMYASAAKG